MGKNAQNKKKGKGAVKTAMKKENKLAAKHKKMLARIGERDIGEIVLELEQEQLRLTTVVEEICEAPSPRSNFSFVAHPSADELILFGGELYNGKSVIVYNNMYFYNVQNQQWKHLRVPCGPTPRCAHQMVAVPTPTGGELWLFGGEHASPSQLQFFHFNDLWRFDLSLRCWEKVLVPNMPSPRSGHRMVLSKRNIVLFGGFYDNYQKYEYYNDVHIFNLDTRTWRQITPEGFLKPAPRSGCCMAACTDGRIVIWGGYTKTKVRKLVDAGRTFTDMFEIVPQADNAEKFHWRSIKPGGVQMPALNSVGFTAGPSSEVYCFGGVVDLDEDDEHLQGQFTQELSAFNLANQSWRLCKITEKKDKQASGDSTAIPTPSVNAFLVNRANMFRKQSRFVPTPRMHAGLCVLKNTLYVYGGMFEELERIYTFNDFYALDLNKMQAWQVLIPNNENVHEWVESDGEDETEAEASDDVDDDVDEEEEDDDEEEEDDDDDGDDDESNDDNDDVPQAQAEALMEVGEDETEAETSDDVDEEEEDDDDEEIEDDDDDGDDDESNDDNDDIVPQAQAEALMEAD